MNSKKEILNNICYTELVYGRINKKLKTNYSVNEIETMLFDVIQKTDEVNFKKKGKNFYIFNKENDIRITVNSNTFRVITVDVFKKAEVSN